MHRVMARILVKPDESFYARPSDSLVGGFDKRGGEAPVFPRVLVHRSANPHALHRGMFGEPRAPQVRPFFYVNWAWLRLGKARVRFVLKNNRVRDR